MAATARIMHRLSGTRQVNDHSVVVDNESDPHRNRPDRPTLLVRGARYNQYGNALTLYCQARNVETLHTYMWPAANLNCPVRSIIMYMGICIPVCWWAWKFN